MNSRIHPGAPGEGVVYSHLIVGRVTITKGGEVPKCRRIACSHFEKVKKTNSNFSLEANPSVANIFRFTNKSFPKKAHWETEK